MLRLQRVLDYRKRPVNIVKDVGGGRVEFDTEVKSIFPVTNTDGTLRREIAVQGVILGKSEFSLLTDAVLLTELEIG